MLSWRGKKVELLDWIGFWETQFFRFGSCDINRKWVVVVGYSCEPLWVLANLTCWTHIQIRLKDCCLRYASESLKSIIITNWGFFVPRSSCATMKHWNRNISYSLNGFRIQISSVESMIRTSFVIDIWVWDVRPLPMQKKWIRDAEDIILSVLLLEF